MVKKSVLGVASVILLLVSGLVMAQDGPNGKLNRAVIKIDTLTCGACFSSINAGLAPMEGFSGMGANLFRKLIAVDFSDPLTTDEIMDKLESVGYPGTLESAEEISQKESFAYIDSRRPGFGSGGGCCSVPGQAGQSPGLLPSAAGSCCILPGSTAPTENL